MNAQVEINSLVLSEEQTDRLFRMAVIMFLRSERFLRDYAHWNSSRIKENLQDYLGAAEIMHELNSDYTFEHVVFEGGTAKLKGTMEDAFGSRKT